MDALPRFLWSNLNWLWRVWLDCFLEYENSKLYKFCSKINRSLCFINPENWTRPNKPQAGNSRNTTKLQVNSSWLFKKSKFLCRHNIGKNCTNKLKIHRSNSNKKKHQKRVDKAKIYKKWRNNLHCLSIF